MPLHPLVVQLRFTRSQFSRCLTGVSDKESRKRFGSMNSISWCVGHLANQEQRYWLERAQGKILFPELQDLVGTGSPPTTPPLKEMLMAWQTVIEAADPYLENLTVEAAKEALVWNGLPLKENIGTMLLRNIYHYWFHNGEVYAIRQMLGHTNLPQFVGDMSEHQYL